MAYIEGFIVPVRTDNRQAYYDLAAMAAGVFSDYGALRTVECWADDVPHGKQTDFYRAVAAEEGEEVVFSWIEWPSKDVRDSAWPKVMADPRMNRPGAEPPFDGKRMIFGGFAPIVDHTTA